MNLGEQLDELRFNILRDRSDLIAGDSDSLWTDDTLLRYIKDAERRFARQTLILRDGTTPEATQFTLTGPTGSAIYGPNAYPLHKSIIAVLSAKFNNAQSDLLRAGHAMVTPAPPAEYMTWNQPLDFSLPPSDPVAFWTDETIVFARQQRVTFNVFPAPGAAQAGLPINLRVVRLPMTGYGKDCLERESEIPEDYQLDVLEWAAYRAQRTWDGDAGAPTTANDHLAAFNDAVQRAKQEARRKMFTPVSFRYGRNGFSYTR